MTTANKITLVRICMIPVFIVCALWRTNGSITMPIVALIIFCVASFTDFLDGYIARKYNQVTDFGKFVDPLADKLLVTAAYLVFIEQSYIASWMVFIFLAREFIITSLRVVAANKGRVLAASWTGKVKTCVQIAGIIFVFIVQIMVIQNSGLAYTWLCTSAVYYVNLAVVLVTLYSGVDYMAKNWDIIRDGAVKSK